MYDITVIGPAVIDILASPVGPDPFAGDVKYLDKIRLSFGGDALNESVVLARLGKKVQLISKVGEDEAGRKILDYLRENGISTDSIRMEAGLDTAINIILIDKYGERRILGAADTSPRRLEPEDVEAQLNKGETAGIVCFASMFISPRFTIKAMKDLFSRIKAEGRTLIVDMTHTKNRETLEDLRDLFPYMDVFVPNDEEIGSLTGDLDPVRNAALLVESGVKTAVVKAGARGCIVATRDGVVEIPSVKGVQCVDTTGAGDCFAAVFLAATIKGYPVREACQRACRAASLSTLSTGASGAILAPDTI